MASVDTLSTLLNLLLMGSGLHTNDWGDQTSTNLQVLEAAIAGVSVVDLTAGSVTLTSAQYGPRLILLTGAPASPATVTFPAIQSTWNVVDLTTSGQANKIVASGSAMPLGLVSKLTTSVYCDGTNLCGLSGAEVPVGTVMEYDGLNLPDPRYAWANGQAISRTTYATAFGALTTTLSGTLTNGQATVAVTTDLSKAGLVGSIVEGVGIPSGTTLVSYTSSQITLSAKATASGAQTLRFLPYGNGDGSTTFNVRDRRETVSVGNSTMGGTTARGLLTTSSLANGANLGQVFGEDRHTTTLSEMPSHGHGINDPGHAHGVYDPGHSHGYVHSNLVNYPAQYGGAPSTNSNGYGDQTGASGTGISIYGAATGISVQNSGGGGSHNNLQPTTVCNFIIRVL